MPDLRWICLPFDQLSPQALYAILRLRAEVFVVEQDCVYQDLDNKDQQALHLCGYQDQLLGAYVRLLQPGVSYAAASIGRVVTAPEVRGAGLGRAVMHRAIATCTERWPEAGITISAQQYLEKFYAALGFRTESEPYMEDGIPHIRMTRP